MDSARGRTENSLENELLDRGHEFNFFQAIRLIQRVQPGRAPVGGSSKPASEAVRLRGHLTLEFPASSIHRISRGREEEPWNTVVSFMGLFGTQGVLPFFYTEWMLQRQALKDTAMAAFLDLFNHRWLSLFYRAWEKHRLPVAIERNLPDVSRSSRIGECIFDISGLGTGGIRKRMRVSDFAVAHYAGLLAQRSRSAMGLQCLLRDYFGFPVEILQFCGAWHRLDQGDRCYLNAPGISNQLGVGAALGDSVWDTQSAFEIRVGPLRYSDFRSFLPGGTAAQEMSDLVTLFAGRAQGFRIRLVLSGSEVPYPQLDPEGSSPRLGWDFWLRDRSACGDRADTVFAEAA